MAERLHIVMPCSRPINLTGIVPNYLLNQEEHPFEIRWHLMVQGPEPDPKGFNKTNEGAAYANTGWLWFPSDDSLQPINLFQRLGEAIQRHVGARAIVFSERRKGVCPYTGGDWPEHPGKLIAHPSNMKRCHVDCTQVFFHHSLRPNFDTRTAGMEADGDFIARTYQQMPRAFVFLPEDYVTFGSLDP